MGWEIKRTRALKVRFEPGVYARMERQAELQGIPVSQLIAFWAVEGLRKREVEAEFYEKVAQQFSPRALQEMFERRPPEAEREGAEP